MKGAPNQGSFIVPFTKFGLLLKIISLFSFSFVWPENRQTKTSGSFLRIDIFFADPSIPPSNEHKPQCKAGWLCLCCLTAPGLAHPEPFSHCWSLSHAMPCLQARNSGFPRGLHSSWCQVPGGKFPYWLLHIFGLQIIHAKNVWCCGEGYFGQNKFAEKVRKSRQNVDRDKSA